MNTYFDEIFCISIDKNIKRREYARYYFSKLNIQAKFFIVEKHMRGGLYGCFNSHITIIKYAYKKNYDKILIFEDDFMPTASYSDINLEKVFNFINNNNNNWDCFYLGYSCFKHNKNLLCSKPITKEIFQYNPLNTHAIIYNRNSMKKILDNYENYIGKVHYDIFLANCLNLNNYCYLPLMFEQNYSLNYDIEPCNFIENIIKLLYPLIFTFNFNYYCSIIIYLIYKHFYFLIS